MIAYADDIVLTTKKEIFNKMLEEPTTANYNLKLMKIKQKV